MARQFHAGVVESLKTALGMADTFSGSGALTAMMKGATSSAKVDDAGKADKNHYRQVVAEQIVHSAACCQPGETGLDCAGQGAMKRA